MATAPMVRPRAIRRLQPDRTTHHDDRALRVSVRGDDGVRLGADRLRAADFAMGDPLATLGPRAGRPRSQNPSYK